MTCSQCKSIGDGVAVIPETGDSEDVVSVSPLVTVWPWSQTGDSEGVVSVSP